MVDTRVGTGLSFSVLGPLAASRDGRPLDLGAPKQRALLAVLLANPNKPISVGRIITIIWGVDASETTAGRCRPMCPTSERLSTLRSRVVEITTCWRSTPPG